MDISNARTRAFVAARAGKITLILSSATMALLLSGCGAPSASVNTAVDVKTTPMEARIDDGDSNAVPPVDAQPEPVEAMPPKKEEPISKPTSSLRYKNGTYVVEGPYTSPAGPESINVTVTLKDDVVTGAEVKPEATHKISVKMQGEFIAGFKAQVIGKKLDDINVTKVSGSSLTPIGFNAAIAEIKTEAKS